MLFKLSTLAHSDGFHIEPLDPAHREFDRSNVFYVDPDKATDVREWLFALPVNASLPYDERISGYWLTPADVVTLNEMLAGEPDEFGMLPIQDFIGYTGEDFSE